MHACVMGKKSQTGCKAVGTIISEKAGIAVRGRANLYLRARRAVQITFLILTGIVLTTTFLGLTSYWAIILLIVSPLVTLLILGRFFCGWVCPVGTILDFVGIVFKRIRKSQEQKYEKSARAVIRRSVNSESATIRFLMTATCGLPAPGSM